MAFLIALILFLLITILRVVYSSLSWGFVAYKFYQWFIVTIGIDVPELTWINFIGIYLFVRIFTFHVNGVVLKDDVIEEDNTTRLLIISPWVIFVLGYVMKLIIF